MHVNAIPVVFQEYLGLTSVREWIDSGLPITDQISDSIVQQKTT